MDTLKIDGIKSCRASGLLGLAVVAALLFTISNTAMAEDSEDIVALWGSVQPPAVVELKPVTLDPGKTAFLVLDIEELTCNMQRRPRCIDTVPDIKAFLKYAREKGAFVAHSNTGKGSLATILPAVKPQGDEPVVQSSVDKFFHTELESILRARGVETVIISGTTAEGAVIHTATAAAMRGFNVVVPIDGMSAATLYAEQYTAWHLLNGPGSSRKTVLSRFGEITLN